MTTGQHILDYYAAPGELTGAGNHSDRLAALPAEVDRLVQTVRHLGIYDVVAQNFYGVALSEEHAAAIHLRSAQQMLDHLFAVDDRPLDADRAPQQRIACRCHAFTKLIVTFLRNRGIPARSRCGFSAYFNPERFEDHWVCEYWNRDNKRWVLVDAQLDEVWHEKLGIDWDTLDVSRERFLVAADAWRRCRREDADPQHFGISFHEGMRGLWFIAGNLVRDAAALSKMEMLPWDVWGGAPGQEMAFSAEQLAFYDHLAALTQEPDRHFDELQALYRNDQRLQVPQTVFNNLRQRAEPVAS